MNKVHIEDIENSITLYTKKKTSNILEGGFRSLFHGKSLDFDDLREYSYGDDVHDIDWKASSRSGKTLIRKNTAEKKHNLLIIPDNSIKMDGDTQKGINKKELCTRVVGSLSKIAKNNNIDFAMLFGFDNDLELTSFLSSDEHTENIISLYQEANTSNTDIFTILKHALENIQKRMLVVIISDLDGLLNIDDKQLVEAEEKNDLFYICLNDAKLTSPNSFDLETNTYFHNSYLSSSYLKEIEEAAISIRVDAIKDKVVNSNARIIFIDDEEDYYTQLDYLFASSEV